MSAARSKPANDVWKTPKSVQHALYVGGSFETPGRNIARWNGQTWSSLSTGLNDIVRAITVYDSGTGPALYASGHFYMSNSGQETRGIARWDGSAWQAVGTGLTLGGAPWQPNVGHGYSMAVLDLGDGPKLYVGGRFTTAGGISVNNIARWDGQQWSAVGPVGSGVFGANSQVMKVGLFDHGFGPQLTIGGRFSLTQTGAVRPRVARWTGPQGGWVQVGSDLSADPAHTVNSFVTLPCASGPALHVGGIFTGATWLNQVNYAARLGAGAPDWVGLHGGMSDYIWSVAASQSGQTLYAGGKFDFAGDAVAKRVARWDGAEWQGLETHNGLTGPGYAACRFDDGGGEKVYIGGAFVGAGNHVCNGIAAWDGEWHQVGGGVRFQDGTPGQVHSLAVFDAGGGPALYAGGLFNVAGGGPCFNIARWDGSFWSSPGGNGPNDTVRALAAFDDGLGPALYVGGGFGASAGIPTPGIVRFNGTTWSGVGFPSVGVTVNAMAVFDDGQGPALYAGGQFLQIGGLTTPSIARWNGSGWSAVGGGITISAINTFPGVVNALTVHNDGSGPALYAGGQFAGAGGMPVHGHIARFRAGAWTAVGGLPSLAPTGSVHALASADGGSGPKLYVGGQFTSTYAGQTAKSLVCWDGSAWSAVGQGVVASLSLGGSGLVKAIAARGDSLLIAGAFAGAGGVRSDHVAEWRGCSCYADCNASGSLTIADFGCFQSRFGAGDPWADCNAQNGLTIADFACFQSAFAAGCP